MLCFLTESNTCFMAFHVTQIKYVKFLHRLILHTAAAQVYVSPRPHGFFHLVSFHFKKRKESEKILQEKLRNENEQDENKMKEKQN